MSERITLPTPKELDAQSTIKVDEWVDVESEKFQQVCQERGAFDYILKVGLRDPAFIHADALGRLWGKGSHEWFPFHDVIDGRTYGYRISKKASN